MNHKLNWAGAFEAYNGYGYYNLKLLEAVASFSNVEVSPIHVKQLSSWTPTLFNLAGYDINRPLVLVHQPNEDLLKNVPGRVWPLTMYESTHLPDEWVENINHFCERVLVPSQFCAVTFRENGINIPIHIVPGGIDTEISIIKNKVNRPYTFMALVDRGSRKGWDLAWRAFYDVFGKNNKDVRLILKMREWSDEQLSRHMVEYGTDERLSIYRRDVDRFEDLYINADCYVFPSRGEGYGLPPREAAACGLPVIATRWGGLDDNLDEWALPIEVSKLKESQLPAGGLWAEPNYDNLCEHMIWCYENQDEAKQKGLEASNWLRENRTWMQAGLKMYKLIEEYMV